MFHNSIVFTIMDLQFAIPRSFFLPMTILLISIAIGLIKRLKLTNLQKKLPPGPRKLPLLGNIHQLVGFLPHRSLRSLANKHGALIHLQLGQLSTIVISSSGFAKEVMKNNDDFFSSRPKRLAPRIISYDCTNIVFSPYGSYWRQMRKICVTELLSAKRVQSFGKVREEEVGNLINSICLSQNSPINLSRIIFSLSYGITARAAFGKKCAEQDEYVNIMTEITKLAGGFYLADFYPSLKILEVASGLRPKLERHHKKVDMILEKIIVEHKKKRASKRDEDKDLVDVLLDVQENGQLDFPLSNDNIKAVILDIFSAGSETSASTVEWVMSELVKNPSYMEKTQTEVREVFKGKGNVNGTRLNELKFLRSVVKEVLRLHSTVPLIPRECRKNCQIGGFEIPKGTQVIINTWAIGRDMMNWNRAEEFIPERFLESSIDFKGTEFEFIPFGAGRRICPGISFAVANIELTLAQFLYHFDWELPGGMKNEELDMDEEFGVTMRRKHDLVVIPTAFHPLPIESK